MPLRLTSGGNSLSVLLLPYENAVVLLLPYENAFPGMFGRSLEVTAYMAHKSMQDGHSQVVQMRTCDL